MDTGQDKVSIPDELPLPRSVSGCTLPRIHGISHSGPHDILTVLAGSVPVSAHLSVSGVSVEASLI